METLKEFFIEIFTDGFIGIALGIIIWLLALSILFLIVFGLAYLVNFTFLPEKEGYGKVIYKEFIKAHSETIMIYNAALKMSMPQTFYYSDNYSLTIEVDGDQDTVSVTRDFYSRTNYYDILRVKYINGRLWKSLKIKNIFKK